MPVECKYCTILHNKDKLKNKLSKYDYNWNVERISVKKIPIYIIDKRLYIIKGIELFDTPTC